MVGNFSALMSNPLKMKENWFGGRQPKWKEVNPDMGRGGE